MWRMFEYEMTRRYPSVTSLAVHLEGQNYVTYDEGDIQTAKEKLSELERYFLRPEGAEFDFLTYPEYFKKYQIAKTVPKSIKPTWTDQAEDLQKKVVYRRRGEHVTRLEHVRMQQGERWYLRVLLRHVSARSYEDLKTVSSQNSKHIARH